MIVKNKPKITWIPEIGYAKEVPNNDYPIRIFNANSGTGLILILQSFEKDLEYLCRGLYAFNMHIELEPRNLRVR